ncbi:50S ribosomal protein L11 methyltransferase [Arenibacter sp. GZD96]|uniref:50S ribosomal protein L11 methyltransferase n=1 Tax=Aurantibrevibacter litoralis TaxID=3106030 RepID=UPI002AFEF866|nr:50S ribosomal protein L11 methyltransferase [Arenibacter sp. GZD-96]MEA1784660.1 50S ribosomal protein L11 methyltransferase [Arenibacter sp. GZD-96]
MAYNHYIEYVFTITPLQPASDILMAELGEVGFESFLETETGVMAYIQTQFWSADILKDVAILSNPIFKIEHHYSEIAQQNWNATWEQNFNPIYVEDVCMVRAPFHPKPHVKYDIVIEPKMSFGTGHHETTYMMLQHILEEDFQHKSVLDMGSGTGVLAILAALKGATRIDAIDIDNWCYQNAMENVARNHCEQIRVLEGDVSLLEGSMYDVILANINRNILLEDIPHYAKSLNNGGILLVSGFYQEDLILISEKCNQMKLKFEKKRIKNNWVAAKYVF